jgi:hypothetical protein
MTSTFAQGALAQGDGTMPIELVAQPGSTAATAASRASTEGHSLKRRLVLAGAATSVVLATALGLAFEPSTASNLAHPSVRQSIVPNDGAAGTRHPVASESTPTTKNASPPVAAPAIGHGKIYLAILIRHDAAQPVSQDGHRFRGVEEF